MKKILQWIGSPYSATETFLRWPFYHFFPSTRNPTALSPCLLPYIDDRLREASVTRLVFFGDLMPLRGERVPQAGQAFRQLLQGADFVIGNLEAPVVQPGEVTERRLSTALHFSPQYLGDTLEALSLPAEKTIFSLANNHLGDHGENGVLSTVHFLEKSGLRFFGLYRGGEVAPAIFTHAELRLGLFGWTQWMNRDILHGTARAYRLPDVFQPDWRELKSRNGLHTLIAAPHWQLEFRHFPESQARQWARQMAEAGFDLLIAHHPHVPSPVEKLGEALCCYSLGNLVGVHLSWPTKIAAIVEAHVVNRGDDTGKIAMLHARPFFFHKIDGTQTVTALHELPERLRKKVRRRWEMLYPPARE